MRHCLRCIALMLSLFCLTACHDDEENEPKKETATKTVLFFIPYSGDEYSEAGSLYPFLMSNLHAIEQSIVADGGLNDTRLLVWVEKKHEEAALIEVCYADGQCSRDTLKRVNGLDITTQDGIVQMLNNAYKVAPTPIYAMIIGAHGTGWLPKGSKPWKGPKHAYGGQSTKVQANIEDLAAAIKQSNIQKMQYICFDDCYMANIETAYALREATDVMIASTSEILAMGIPYDFVWKDLVGTPDYKQTCEKFLTFYNNYETPCGSLSAINCPATIQLAKIMRTINHQFTFDETELSNIQALDGFNETAFFDMEDYVNHLCNDPELLNEFSSALQQCVIATATTPSIYTYYSGKGSNYIPVKHACGITISDPSKNASVVSDIMNTEWWKATH